MIDVPGWRVRDVSSVVPSSTIPNIRDMELLEFKGTDLFLGSKSVPLSRKSQARSSVDFRYLSQSQIVRHYRARSLWRFASGLGEAEDKDERLIFTA